MNRSQRAAPAARIAAGVRPDGLRVGCRLGASIARIIADVAGGWSQDADNDVPLLGFENALEAGISADALEIFPDDSFRQHCAQSRFRRDNLLPFLTIFNSQDGSCVIVVDNRFRWRIQDTNEDVPIGRRRSFANDGSGVFRWIPIGTFTRYPWRMNGRILADLDVPIRWRLLFHCAHSVPVGGFAWRARLVNGRILADGYIPIRRRLRISLAHSVPDGGFARSTRFVDGRILADSNVPIRWRLLLHCAHSVPNGGFTGRARLVNWRILADGYIEIWRRLRLDVAHSVPVGRFAWTAWLVSRWILADGYVPVRDGRDGGGAGRSWRRMGRWMSADGHIPIGWKRCRSSTLKIFRLLPADALLLVDDARFGDGLQVQIVHFLRAQFRRRNRTLGSGHDHRFRLFVLPQLAEGVGVQLDVFIDDQGPFRLVAFRDLGRHAETCFRLLHIRPAGFQYHLAHRARLALQGSCRTDVANPSVRNVHVFGYAPGLVLRNGALRQDGTRLPFHLGVPWWRSRFGVGRRVQRRTLQSIGRRSSQLGLTPLFAFQNGRQGAFLGC